MRADALAYCCSNLAPLDTGAGDSIFERAHTRPYERNLGIEKFPTLANAYSQFEILDTRKHGRALSSQGTTSEQVLFSDSSNALGLCVRARAAFEKGKESEPDLSLSC